MTTGISRRTLLANGALVGGAAFFGPWRVHHVYAQKKDKPILIGLTHDASGQFANSGQDEQRGTIMAIDEANAKGGVLGRKLTYITADTETTPATGSRVAERMITRNEVAFLVGAIQSGVANAIGQVAQKYGVVYFNTNSSSPTESGKDCKRVKFVWDGSGANFALAAAARAKLAPVPSHTNFTRWQSLPASVGDEELVLKYTQPYFCATWPMAFATPDWMAPTRNATLFRVIIRSATREPVAGVVSVSAVTYVSLRPSTPPLALISSIAMIVPRCSSWPLLANCPLASCVRPIRIGLSVRCA
jgi:hypothetical protein